MADVAVAFRGSAADSVGRQARFDGVAGWATKGVKLGDISQLLVGFRGAYERDTTAKAALRGTGDVVARLYVGSNTYKVSFEGQGTGRASSQPKWLFRVGGEFEAAKTIWVEFGAGWQATGRLDGGTLTHSVTFHLAPPNQ